MKKALSFLMLFLLLAAPVECFARSSKGKKKTTYPINVYGWSKTVTSDNQVELFPQDRFLKISNYTSVPVTYVISKTPSVTIKGPKDQISKISVGNDNFTVSISCNQKIEPNLSGLTICVTSPEVGTLSAFGSGDITAERVDCTGATLQSFGSGNITVGTVDCTGLKINLYGSGDVRVKNLDATSVQAVSQGSGNVLVGTADVTGLNITLQGSGNISFKKVDGTGLRAINQGSGDIEVSGDFTTASLIQQGSGDIVARGVNATRVTKENHGTGKIRD